MVVAKTTSWSVKRACMVAPATITALAIPMIDTTTRWLQKSRSPRSTLHVANRGPTTTTAATTTTPKRQGRRYHGRCIADASVSQLFVLCRPVQIIEVPPIPCSLLLVWLPLVVRRRRSVRSRRWRKSRSGGRCEKPSAQCGLEGLALAAAELHRGSECCNLPLATCACTQSQNKCKIPRS